MPTENINKVAVIGAGTMGAQISMVCALAGYSVVLQDVSADSLENGKGILEEQMMKRVKKGRLTSEKVSEAFNLIQFTTSLEDLKEVDFVVEAIVEKLDIKRDLFAKLDQITPKHAILATNSSTIVSSKLADATNRPEQVCNVHFFNPALVMELVEVVRGPHTSTETAETAMEFVKSINKYPVLLNKEISGFVANRILGKLMDEAVYLLENGIASHEDIDIVCKKALNHPIGPFALMDLTGLDVNYLVRMQRYQESGDERDKPSKIVKEKVEKGELGRKTGKGFYTYENTPAKV
ncbi:3-hydroxyacyl-CoA dehydrogenase family protein [Mesobacillus maritimus]|uniref:3-hydroxyacyl-CoA dehydrogenase family protein n=1 Tax=Mesobacillus maritimus TaxID=1643336 RepID=UPI00203CDCB8|nr:3-hydroxyacyl-CoA dehydrogenase family protein [Mesobacillus maritimus]MCM3588017.1 3-hydroxyacyl-CoA dehydrogenase family protein [Mesobacillus maritimus]MCM3668347.1 3-hydroxyacyl-CoA dehydrogenase family protein [Mesobacillus maritimus]